MQEFQFFDPAQELTIVTKQLRHWAQAGTLTFITWRTADSLPQTLQHKLTRERAELLSRFAVDPHGDWKPLVERLPAKQRGRLQWALFQMWDDLLDRGAGACELRRPELSAMVEKSLLHFDGERYLITDSVVMPNHVHLLAAFPDEHLMSDQCE